MQSTRQPGHRGAQKLAHTVYILHSSVFELLGLSTHWAHGQWPDIALECGVHPGHYIVPQILTSLPASLAHGRSTVLFQSCKLCAPTCKPCPMLFNSAAQATCTNLPANFAHGYSTVLHKPCAPTCKPYPMPFNSAVPALCTI